MSQPPPYAPSTAFVSYQGQQSWFPGQQLDAEFNNLDTIIGDIEANLALIQRDDGALANGSVTYNSLSPTLQTAGLSPLTSWATGVQYIAPQAVIFGTGLYQCQINHVSGTFSADLAAGKWLLLANLAILSGVSTVAANLVAAGPSTGSAATPVFRALVGADLPAPTQTTLGGIESAAAVAHQWINSISTAGAPVLSQPAFTDVSGTATIAQGGTGQVTAAAAITALMPTATRNGDVAIWNGTNWTTLAGNNSGTKLLQEDSSGNVSWVVASGTGTVTSLTAGTGLSGGTITTSGTVAVSLTNASNVPSGDVLLNNVSNFFDGPSVAQGTSGTWYASGTVTVGDIAGAATFNVKLWDGTTVIASTQTRTGGAANYLAVALSGILASPAANIRISAQDTSSTSGVIRISQSGLGKDSTITAIRIA